MLSAARSTGLLLCAALAMLGPVQRPTQEVCSFVEAKNGICGTTSVDTLTLVGERASAGQPGRAGDRPGGSSGPPAPPSWLVEQNACVEGWDSSRACFRGMPDAVPEEPSTPEAPTVTIDDLAQFSPPGTPVVGEPDNMGVAGLPEPHRSGIPLDSDRRPVRIADLRSLQPSRVRLRLWRRRAVRHERGRGELERPGAGRVHVDGDEPRLRRARHLRGPR